MTERELSAFVRDKEIEWRGESLILWLHPYELPNFAELLGGNYLDSGGMEVSLLSNGVIALDIVDICNDFGIEPANILKTEEVEE